ncbi:MAG: FAD-dependent thymidylate synthase [candidate division WOR-3 bacterium]
MKVLLAGFNIDTEVLAERAKVKRIDVTPETISAAYARISRSPLPVDQLRKIARKEVVKARQSNRTIIFEMGHHSVAEHAVFNLDIIGVSRLAVEEIEKFRLNSYTEKSQRYVTLKGDYVVPRELRNSKYLDDYLELIELQNRTYKHLFERLKEKNLSLLKRKNLDRAQLRNIENRVKEDARYILSLATQTQLGMTINGRNLELMLRRFSAHPLAEVRELGTEIYQQIKEVAPSIIIFHRAGAYEKDTFPKNIYREKERSCPKSVTLIDYTRNGDDMIIAALMNSTSQAPFKVALSRVKKMGWHERQEFLKARLKNLQLYDALPREFEYACLTFELIVSASCFAQLKRHRIATITSQLYDPDLGVTIPEAVKRAGEEKRFYDIIRKAETVYKKIKKEKNEMIAQYLLTNSHRRRVLFSCNLRELYHISRLREDMSAQWDIRKIVGAMVAEAKRVMPLTSFLIGGKDRFPQIYHGVYGKYPRVIKGKLPGIRRIR